jgi:hypothetical protein
MSRSARRLPRTALAIGLAAFLSLAGTGVASAMWNVAAAPVTGSATAGTLTMAQTGSAALAKTYTSSNLVGFAPITVTNTGSVPNTFTLRVAAATGNNLANAITLSGWSVATAASCTATPPGGSTVLTGPSLTAGITFSGAQLAAGASVFYCIKTSVQASQTATAGTPATVNVILSSAIGNWASNSTTTASQQVQPPDTTAPSAPTTLAASGTTGSQTTLTWTASTDNVGVTGYDVLRAGVVIGTVTGTSFTDTGLTRDTAYSYTVTAHDAAGNVSAASNAVAVTTLTVSSGSKYQIRNPNSGLCIDAGASGAANATPLIIYGCSTARVQIWQFLATSGGYYEVLVSSSTLGWDFDINGGLGQNNGQKAQLWAYGGGANQQWQAVSEGAGTGKVHFVNLNSGKCLDVPSATTVSGTQLQQYDCNATVAQTFVMTLVP